MFMHNDFPLIHKLINIHERLCLYKEAFEVNFIRKLHKLSTFPHFCGQIFQKIGIFKYFKEYNCSKNDDMINYKILQICIIFLHLFHLAFL